MTLYPIAADLVNAKWEAVYPLWSQRRRNCLSLFCGKSRNSPLPLGISLCPKIVLSGAFLFMKPGVPPCSNLQTINS
jgi:hypothetical protein